MNQVALYQARMNEVCGVLPKMGLKYLVMHIIFNDKSNMVLSNNLMLSNSFESGFRTRQPFELTQKIIHILHDSSDADCEDEAISPQIKSLFEDNFSISPAYTLIRKNAECTFLFSAVEEHPSKCAALLYQKTCKAFEKVCMTFVDTFLELIIDLNPEYKNAFILNNKILRDAVIKQGFEKNINLSMREKECLMAATEGKSVKEIARLLQISPNTVKQYLKKIREEFNDMPLPAIFIECMHRGIIGKVSYFGRKMPARPHLFCTEKSSGIHAV